MCVLSVCSTHLKKLINKFHTYLKINKLLFANNYQFKKPINWLGSFDQIQDSERTFEY